MDPKPTSSRFDAAARGVLVFIVLLLVAVSRRWAQVVSPQVWCEDGWIIGGTMVYGWHELLRPLNGYLVLLPKLITRLSLEVSVSHYPAVSTAIAFGVDALVAAGVALCPTRLRARYLCALGVLLVPCDVEVFGLPLYTMWWAGVLLLLVALWDEARPCLWLRLPFVAVAGLSSPFILVVLPVLALRIRAHRRLGSEWAVGITAGIVATIQAAILMGSARMGPPSLASAAGHVLPKFLGWFLVGNLLGEHSLFLWPAAIAMLAAAGYYLHRTRREPMAWVLVYLLFGAIASSITRADPSIAQPALAGPRYFFFPFILDFWILIQVRSLVEGPRLRRAALGALALAGLNALPVWSRRHDDLHWTEHLVSGRLFPSYDIPTQFDGRREDSWPVTEDASWRRYTENDPLLSREDMDAMPTFAYRVIDASRALYVPLPPGHPMRPMVLSRLVTAAGRGINVRLERGSRVRFRSAGAAAPLAMQVVGQEALFQRELPVTRDWVTLEFSNSRLPADFTVRVLDEGQGTGEWEPAP